MVQVLCYSCSTYLADTDVARLDWPMSGEMFSPVYPGWTLRPGQLNLDIWCPVCGQFPFSHDPYTHGGGAVGKNLNVRGADGKPVVLTVKQILMGKVEGPVMTAMREASELAGNIIKAAMPSPPAFPCPSCGAKKRFHKKGCALAPGSFKEAQKQVDEMVIAKRQMPDPHLASMESRVSGGPDRSADPTPEEIAAVARERESRRERSEPVLRPGEGFASKGIG